MTLAPLADESKETYGLWNMPLARKPMPLLQTTSIAAGESSNVKIECGIEALDFHKCEPTCHSSRGCQNKHSVTGSHASK
jgi:hypothetical protein